jgi:hypothetical protein
LDGKKGIFSNKRFSLGFLNGNRLQVVVFGIVCFSVCFFNERMNVWRRIIIGVVYFVICLLTASYTGAIVGFFVYGMSWIATYVKWDRWSDVLSVAIVCTFAFFIVISILAAAEVKGSFMEKFDHLITGRMNQLRYHITSEEDLLPWISNWRLFSPRNHKNVYDLGYVQLFYYYGIIPAVCYLAFVFYAVYVAWRERNVLGSLAIWACGIYLFMEAAYFSNYLQRDFLLMAAAFVVMGGMGKNAEKNNTVDV